MTESVLIEGPHGFVVGAQAFLLDPGDREMAWAEQHVIQNSAYRWILGRYVQAEAPNQNGHIFNLDDLRAQQHTVVHAPLNMLHRPHYNVGAFVASELLYPKDGEIAASPLMPEYKSAVPFMEALAAYWHYYFRDEYVQSIVPAYKEGRLFYSMEAVPPTITCPQSVGGCGQEFKYKGRQHDSYCAHLNVPLAAKVLNKPHFTAGALIIPPVKPGWKNADITQMSELLTARGDDLELYYEGAKQMAPHLDAKQWEEMMAQLLVRSDTMTDPDNPHSYRPAVAGDSTSPCEVCNFAADDVAHHPPQPKPSSASIEDGISSYGDYELAYEYARDFSSEKRKDLAKKGLALEDGSFPVVTVGDLNNAISAWGRCPEDKRGTLKSFLLKRARALNVGDDKIEQIEDLGSGD